MVYGPAMLFAGIAVIIAARQLRTAPRWWRVLGYIGGACAVLSSAYFPFYLFAVCGVGVWGLIARVGRRCPRQPGAGHLPGPLLPEADR